MSPIVDVDEPVPNIGEEPDEPPHIVVETETETWGAVPGKPAESESLGKEKTPMVVVDDPESVAAEQEAQALKHPTVSGSTFPAR